MIDTENKRRSAGQHLTTTIHPVPDSTIAMADRANVTWLYSGLDYSGDGPVPSDGAGGWVGAVVRRRRRGS